MIATVWNYFACELVQLDNFDHVMPVLHELHCLLIHKSIYKLAVMVYKCLRGLVPPYLGVDCLPVTRLASRTGYPWSRSAN